MLRLPDDIEEFLITGQHRRAIHALASRRCITPGQARDQVRARVFEMLIETGVYRDAPAQVTLSLSVLLRISPQARQPAPFILWQAGEDQAVLITPFQKGRGCLKPVEIAQVEAVIARLGSGFDCRRSTSAPAERPRQLHGTFPGRELCETG